MLDGKGVLTGRHFRGAASKRRRALRKTVHGVLASVASFALIASGMVVGLVGGAAPAQADYATAGSGPYQSRIYWFDMANFPLNTVGGSQTFSPAPGVNIKMTLQQLSPYAGSTGQLVAQALDGYSGSPAGQAYKPSGKVSMANAVRGSNMLVVFNWEMTINGRTVTPRIVATDGEATSSSEQLIYETFNNTTWTDFQTIVGAPPCGAEPYQATG